MICWFVTYTAIVFALVALSPARAEANAATGYETSPCPTWDAAHRRSGRSAPAPGRCRPRPIAAAPSSRPRAWGDWCQTPIGGCQIGTQAALDRACQWPSPAGMVNGWVTRQ
jgi:hypothetical protein